MSFYHFHKRRSSRAGLSERTNYDRVILAVMSKITKIFLWSFTIFAVQYAFWSVYYVIKGVSIDSVGTTIILLNINFFFIPSIVAGITSWVAIKIILKAIRAWQRLV